MDALQARKEALLARLSTAEEPAPLLHPTMADLYRTRSKTLLRRYGPRAAVWKRQRRSVG